MDNTNEPIRLTAEDLQSVCQVIDLATSRGAFKAAELSKVGSLFDRLTEFLSQVAAVAATQQAQPAPGAGTQESVSTPSVKKTTKKE
jgi:hypothetical protein